jgi:hypothetical protein
MELMLGKLLLAYKQRLSWEHLVKLAVSSGITESNISLQLD